MRNRSSARIVGVAAATAACALLGMQEPASAANHQQAFCEDGWEQSSAYDYCPNATISWHQKASLSCTVNVTCTVNVDVGGTSQRISETVSADTTGPQSLNLCIRRTADDSDWELLLAGNCGSATDADTAVADGLPAP